MANVTIPNLPQQTTVTNLDKLAIVDSGDTTTSHITRSDLLSKESITTKSIVLTNSPSTITSTNGISMQSESVNANGNRGIQLGQRTTSGSINGAALGGRNCIGTIEGATVAGGRDNNAQASYASTFGGQSNTNYSSFGSIFGGQSNSLNSLGGHPVIVGGRANSSTAPESNTIVGGLNCTISSTNSYSFIAGGYNNEISSSGSNTQQNQVYGGSNNLISNGNFSAIFAGNNNTISSTGNTSYNHILGGQNNTISGTSTNVTMINCSGRTGTDAYTTYVENLEVFEDITTNTGNIYANNTDINIYDSTESFSHSVRIGGGTITNTSNVFGTTIGGRNNTNSGSNTHLFGGFVNSIQGEDNAIVTGRQNTIGNFAEFNFIAGGRSNTINTGCFYSTILGGQNNIIANGEQHASIIGGKSNTTNGYRSVIVGGQSNTLNADNSSMIACSGRTGSNNYTTYVETLEAFDGIVMTDYAALNFTGDTAAAAGGVPLGGLYHDAGAMRIRIT